MSETTSSGLGGRERERQTVRDGEITSLVSVTIVEPVRGIRSSDADSFITNRERNVIRHLLKSPCLLLLENDSYVKVR